MAYSLDDLDAMMMIETPAANWPATDGCKPDEELKSTITAGNVGRPLGQTPANKAVWLTAKRDGLAIKRAPFTPPGEDQTLISNSAVAISPVEWLTQFIGDFACPWLKYSFILGSDVAGEVVAAGSAVSRFRVGDRVLGHAVCMEKSQNSPAESAFQPYTVLLEHMASPIPATMAYESAAVLPLGLSTTACGLFQKDFVGETKLQPSGVKLSGVAWLGTALLSACIVLVSYRCVAHVGPVAPTVAKNSFVQPWIIIHVAGAATALLLSSPQFRPGLWRRWPMVHRWTGWAYVVGCLVDGASGLVLAAGASAGALVRTGFSTVGVLWIYVTAQGWSTARAGRFPEHRRWMIRSFALTFAAVTLRIYLPIAMALGFSLTGAYQVIAWLSWVPNGVLAKLYLRRGIAARGAIEIAPQSSAA